MKKNKTIQGSICGLMTGVCWGVSGVFGQFLFETRGVETAWLVPIRLFSSGCILLLFSLLTNRAETLKLPARKRDFLQAILAGVLGTMMFQFTFFGTVQRSNAGTATVLQYLAPLIIMVYVCARERRLPKKFETLALLLAVGGIFLISTHGNIHSLVMTPSALVWGISCAFFMSLNTVLPESLYRKYSSTVIIGWAFLFGGVVLVAVFRPWTYAVAIDPAVILSMCVIVLGGSVAAYLFYASSVKYIGPEKASLFACVEPVVATILSACWLGTDFQALDLAGFVLILSTIVILNHTGHTDAK